MGFWSSVGRGLTGAVSGFVSSGGNPLGAAAGGVAGLASGGGDTSSGTSSSTSTQTQNLREQTGQERQLTDQTYSNLLAAGRSLSPEEEARIRDERYQSLYGTASTNINQAANVAQQSGYASDARRGLAGSSNSATQAAGREGIRQRNLGAASTDANLGADQLVQQERAFRLANSQQNMANLNALWNQRLIGSSVTNTGSGVSTSTSPDNFWASAAEGVGNYVGGGGTFGGLFGGNDVQQPVQPAPGTYGPPAPVNA